VIAVYELATFGWKVIDRFHFGSKFAISPHGLGIAIGYLAGAYVLIFEGKRRGIPEEASSSLVFWALIGAIIGARLFYVIGHFSEFNGIGDMLAVYKGGISLIGGIVGAVVLAYPFMRKHKLGFLRVMDNAGIGLPLGIVIGRIGDLIIGDHLGRPTSWALAFGYHGGNLSGYDCTSFPGRCTTILTHGQQQVITATSAKLLSANGAVIAQGTGVHQTAMYDFVSSMILVSIVLWVALKPRRTGVLFFTFVIWYGIGRVITDFLRVDKRFFGLTGSQWTSAAVVVLAIGTLVWWRLHPASSDPPEVLAAQPVPVAGTVETPGTPESVEPPSDPPDAPGS
jgi:phosphatidylglycerol:prolipoprotein diacylglycerol transferase